MSSVCVSALGFFAATFGVSLYSNIDIISSMTFFMARGAIVSGLVVMFILPSMLVVFDKVIIKTTKGFSTSADFKLMIKFNSAYPFSKNNSDKIK